MQRRFAALQVEEPVDYELDEGEVEMDEDEDEDNGAGAVAQEIMV